MAYFRKARECALQMLYQWDVSQGELSSIQSSFWKATRGSSETRYLANQLFQAAAADAAIADELIVRHSENWRIERMAAIDRSILRLAVHELRRGETPEKVVINEALELTKKYSEPDAVGFVNAILDSIRKDLAATKHA